MDANTTPVTKTTRAVKSAPVFTDKGSPVARNGLAPITMPNFLLSSPVVMPIPPKHLPLRPNKDEKANSYSLRLISPSGRIAKWARVYSRPRFGACPVHGEWGHDAWVFLGLEEKEDAEFLNVQSLEEPHVSFPDIPWPTECECGTPFTGRDLSCIHSRMLFTDGVDEFIPEDAPIGSIIDTPWAPSRVPHSKRVHNVQTADGSGLDGHFLSVITPAGWWAIDVPDATGNSWVRTELSSNVKTLSVLQGVSIESFRGYILNGMLYPYIR